MSEISSGVPSVECKHTWERAPDRDVVLSRSVGVMVFWCRKCLKVETRRVEIEAEADG